MKVNEDKNSGVQRDETGDELKAAHTPTPWKAQPGHRPDEFDVLAVNGYYVATAYEILNDNLLNEAEANARLIAAAPDLLSALTRLVGYGGHVNDCEGSPLGCKASCIAARAAIQKATGEQQ